MTTARDIIESALRKIHVLGVGSSLSGEEADQALDALNTMIASLSVEGMMIYAETIESFSLVSGTSTYTIGTGGDFNTSRPTVIKSATVNLGDDDIRLSLIDFIQYSSIPDKTNGGDPTALYYDANYSLGNIKVWPVPISNGTLTLYSEKPLTEFTDLNTDFAMPPEYKRHLIYALAVELGPEYEREPSPTIIRIANQSKRAIKAQNNKNNNYVSYITIPVGNGLVRIGFDTNESSGGGGFSSGFSGGFN